MARQIARALDFAHERGIVHRDLKPANIKITTRRRREGAGLRSREGRRRRRGRRRSRAAADGTVDGTIDGAIIGTPAYMSPEQARGQPVDKRTDIWAFGCVLYEMLTGRATFSGDTVADTIARVLEREPDWTALPRCDARADSQSAARVSREGSARAPARHRRRPDHDRQHPVRIVRRRQPPVLLAPGHSGRTAWLPWAVVAGLVIVLAGHGGLESPDLRHRPPSSATTIDDSTRPERSTAAAARTS